LHIGRILVNKGCGYLGTQSTPPKLSYCILRVFASDYLLRGHSCILSRAILLAYNLR